MPAPRRLPGGGRLTPPRAVVVGAGPVGLDAALALAERGWRVRVLEEGPCVGHGVSTWDHVRMFTPWAMNVSGRMRRHLAAAGVALPDDALLPTGRELRTRLLEPLAGLPALRGAVRLGVRVRAVGRAGLTKHEEIGSPERSRRPFRLLVAGAGREEVVEADAVLDCGGALSVPNALGDAGIPSPGEDALRDRITRRIPDTAADPAAWAGRTVLLAGAGHSAQTAARDLARLAAAAPGTRVVWVLRDPRPGLGAVDGDTLPERAALTADARALLAGASPAVLPRPGAHVARLAERDGRVVVTLGGAGDGEEVEADRVLALVGAVGDAAVHRQLQVHECYATGGPMRLAAALLARSGAAGGDCLAVGPPSPGDLATSEPGFLILGAKSHGRHGAFLLRNGYAQVDQAVGLLPSAGPVPGAVAGSAR